MTGTTLWVLTLLARLVALVFCARAWQALRVPGFRRAWSLLVIALALWAGGDAFRVGVAGLTGHAPPTPSVTDLLHLAGSLAAVAAMLDYPATPPERLGRMRTLLDVIILSGGLLLLAWLIFLRPVVEIRPASAQEIFWASVEPVTDLVLLGMLTRLLLLTTGRPDASVFRWLGAGFLVQAVGDFASSYMHLQAIPSTSPIAATTLFVGIAMLTMASARMASIAGQSDDFMQRAKPPGRALRVETLLPLGLTYVVVGFAVFDWLAAGTLDWLGLAGGAILTLLLMARQGVMAGQMEMGQYSTLVNTTADLAFVCAPDGRWLFVNPALRAQYLSIEHPLARSSLADVLAPEADPKGVLSTALENGWTGEVGMRRADGQEVPILLTLSPVVEGRRSRPALAGVGHDLTLIKQRESELQTAMENVAAARNDLERLNADLENKVTARTRDLQEMVANLARLNDDLKALDRLKSEFVTLVSHELRAPLTNIRTGIELLLSTDPDLSGRARESLQLVEAETERLTQFVGAILDLSALEAGRFPLQLRPIPLIEAAQIVRDRLPEGDTRRRLVLSLPEDLPAVMADERALVSVLFHLVDNAVKYAPEGEVAIEGEAERGTVVFAVRDSGPGIPEGERERIFEVFHRLDSRDSREVYGHGLGLHLVRKLLEAMHGGIRAEAAPGGGARLVCWLPAASGHDREEMPGVTSSAGGPGADVR
jgi:PAS domain S-box-containing protein